MLNKFDKCGKLKSYKKKGVLGVTMKKLIIFISVILAVILFASCGSSDVDPLDDIDDAVDSIDDIDEHETYIITVSENSGCTLTTKYVFDDDMELESVTQNAEYTDSSLMGLEYSLVLSNDQHFTDIVKEDSSFSCKLTEEAMDLFYPDATYDSILKTANEQNLAVETSK